MGSRKLRKLQIGIEATKGTAVPATTMWRGTGTIEDLSEVAWAEEDIGHLGGYDRMNIVKKLAQIKLDDVPLSFEQAPILCASGIDDVVSGAADGVGTDKIYTYPFPGTSDPGFKTFTWEGGDNQQAEEMEYAFAKEMVFRGAAGETWMMGGTVIGRQAIDTTFTPAITVPSVNDAMFSNTRLYIDDTGGTWGTTEKANTLLEAEITIDTGLKEVFAGDGALYFSFVKRIGFAAKAVLTFEFNGSAVTERGNWRNKVPRLIQLKCLGPAVATGGTLYQTMAFLTNLAGKWEKFEAIDEQDGNDIVRGTFIARYVPADTKFGEVILVNEKATIP